MIMSEKMVEDAAREIEGWVQDAVSDVAYSASYTDLEEKFQKKVDEAKEGGVRDIKGWLADEYYDDVDTLRDLTGDRIYDAALGRGDLQYINMIAIATHIKSHCHTAMEEAMESHIKRWKGYLNEHEYYHIGETVIEIINGFALITYGMSFTLALSTNTCIKCHKSAAGPEFEKHCFCESCLKEVKGGKIS